MIEAQVYESAKSKLAEDLKSDFLAFIKIFFKLRTGIDYRISSPLARECREKIMAQAFTDCQAHKKRRLIINVPPRYGKSTLCIYFVAWSLAKYPTSKFLYVSCSHKLSVQQTKEIKAIMSLQEYRELFNVQLDKSSNAKDNFETKQGGSVYAVGEGGTIVGFGAGLAHTDRFGGAIIIDDIHKPKEVFSDVLRDNACDLYKSTLFSRVNSRQTPIIFVGQRLHDDDLPARLLSDWSGEKWDSIIIEALDSDGNPLDPALHDKQTLDTMREKMPYEFWSQYQQTPHPTGGGIFKRDWLQVIDILPNLSNIFITVDTAETDKTYNDASVFSLWGVYTHNKEPNLIWLDCVEDWLEPKDLESAFLQFYHDSFRFKLKPSLSIIEKKSTGVTLCSVLKKQPGLMVMEIERTRASGSKTARFLACQPYVASNQVSILDGNKNADKIIKHLEKITANDTHKRDDIADTMADAIKIALIDDYFNVSGDNNMSHKAIYDNLKQSGIF